MQFIANYVQADQNSTLFLDSGGEGAPSAVAPEHVMAMEPLVKFCELDQHDHAGMYPTILREITVDDIRLSLADMCKTPIYMSLDTSDFCSLFAVYMREVLKKRYAADISGCDDSRMATTFDTALLECLRLFTAIARAAVTLAFEWFRSQLLSKPIDRHACAAVCLGRLQRQLVRSGRRHLQTDLLHHAKPARSELGAPQEHPHIPSL